MFESATLFLQGQQATIERVLEATEIIQAHLELSLVCRTIVLNKELLLILVEEPQASKISD